MAIITCRDVAFAYEGRTVAQGLNFEVRSGDYLCIVGENGSGKTTLMKGMLGLLKPSAGEIETGDGLKMSDIGYLPQQQPAQKDFPASVWEVVISGRLNSRGMRPFYSKADRRAAAQNMEKLKVGDLRKKAFRELSGGQQQRALLARALCASSKVLVMDEPVTGLDPLASSDLYNTIRELWEGGITVIMISHDIRAAVSQAGSILHLQNRQLFFGSCADYENSEPGKMFLTGRRP